MTFLSNIEGSLQEKQTKTHFTGVHERIARNNVNLHLAIDFNQCHVTKTDLLQYDVISDENV